MYAFGSNLNLQLSLPEGSTGPTRIPLSDALPTDKALFAACGHHHTVIGSADGVFTAGRNEEQQLGRTGRTASALRVQGLDGVVAVAAAAGATFSVVLDATGTVFVCGSGSHGQLGLDAVITCPIFTPLKSFSAAPVVAVAAGARHVVALTANGAVFGWGDNSTGQLGMTQRSVTTPQPIASMRGKPAMLVAAGGQHTLIATVGDMLYSFGANDCGQLGVGDSMPRATPTIATHTMRGLRQLAAGDFHSAARTADGRVYAWGNDKWGQLGQGAVGNPNATTPQLVTALADMGEVTALACGRRHTVVALHVSGEVGMRVYAFGCNAERQLGLPDMHPAHAASACGTPALVALGDDVVDVGLVAAGGDHTLVLHVPPGMGATADAMPPSLELVTATRVRRHLAACDEAALRRAIAVCFASVACISGSFFAPTPQGGLPIDLDAAVECYQELLHGPPGLAAAVMAALPAALRRVDQLHESTEALAALTLIMAFPTLARELDAEPAGTVVRALAALSPAAYARIEATWRAAAAPHLTHAVKVVQGALTRGVLVDMCGAGAQVAMRVLAKLYATNEAAHKLPITAFYNSAVSGLPSLVNDDRIARRGGPGVSYSRWPYVLDIHAKALLVRARNADEMLPRFAAGLFGGSPFLLLRVRRSHVLHDTLQQVGKWERGGLQRPLKVVFEGEEGVDEGGLIKEYFQLAMPLVAAHAYAPIDPAHPEYLWFAAPSDATLPLYHLGGLLLGLALFNGVVVPSLFPPLLYRYLLDPRDDVPVGIADLDGPAPEIARSLRELMAHPAHDVADAFGLTFRVTLHDPVWHAGKLELHAVEHDLVPGGADIAVTSENRAAFVRAYVRALLVDRVELSMAAFREGFHSVCSAANLPTLVRPEELELLCCGLRDWNLADLERAAEYVNGYTAQSQPVRWFWEIVHAMSPEHKAAFLQFATGSARVPVQGLANTRFVIQRTGDVTRLPVAHTCFNVLDLPPYASKEVMQQKLLQAITETEGFTLV